MKYMDFFKSAYTETAFRTQLNGLFNGFAGHQYYNLPPTVDAETIGIVEKTLSYTCEKVDKVSPLPDCLLISPFFSRPRNDGLFDLMTWGKLAFIHAAALHHWKEPSHKVSARILSGALWTVTFPLLLTKYLLSFILTVAVALVFQGTHRVQSLFSNKKQALGHEELVSSNSATCSP